MEPLDDRTLLAVTFEFTIIDPSDKYKSIRPQLQTLLNNAGAEWGTHLIGNAKLEYIVQFSETLNPNNPAQIADGAAKSAEIVRTDPLTGIAVWQVGTALEIIDGQDRNGEKHDGGIVFYGPNTKTLFFDPDTNKRNAPMPEGYFDAYTVILHELAHSLGFVSSRGPLGDIPSIGQYTFDEHVTGFGAFQSFGIGTSSFDPITGELIPDPSSDNAYKVYGDSVSLQIGNPNHLGTGRFVDPGFVNQFPIYDIDQFFVDDLSTDLMAGNLAPGERKTISRLDLAILKDAGTPVDLLADPPEGIFTINGTGLGDNIEVQLANGNLLVRVNNSSQTLNVTQSQLVTAIIINGLNGNDVITLGPGMPAVAVNGGAGADTIYGGPKGDSILGGGGNDWIFGRGGGDVIRGGDGNDLIYGQGGSDRLFGNAGNDHLDGGMQTDRLYGGGNSDTLVGGTEDDFLYGENGNDLLSGAGGKDRMDGGPGSDWFYGGAGNDSVDYSRSLAPVVASIDGSPDDGAANEGDNIIDAENIIGSGFDDQLIGSEGRNSLIGGAGNDTLEGGGGHDTLEGNNGADVLSGGGGNDSLLGGDGDNRFVGGAGLDVMIGGSGADLFVADDDAIDTIDGGDGVDSLSGDIDDVVSNVEVIDSVPAPSRADRAMTPAAMKGVSFE